MKQKTIFVLILALVPMLFFQNCGKPTDLQFSASIDLGSQSGRQDAAIQIMTKNCSSCHSTTIMNGNVGDLTDIQYLTYSRLIIPGEPEISPVITQITQGLMPQGRPGLSGTEVDVLKSWIKGLANDGGNGGAPVEVPVDPKYSVLAAQVFGSRCVTCHANRNYKFGSYTDVLRSVTPGDAANSLLYQVVTVGRTGGKMPQGGALSSAQVKAIQDWINAGAPNN